MGKTAVLLLLSFVYIAALGCTPEWKNPNTTLPATEVKIERITVNPTAYDSAGVIVEGKVWDLKFDKLEQKTDIPYTSFKLADKDGNYVNVFASGHLPIFEGDMVEVTGIYRREFQTESYKFDNEIEAVKVEKM
ncbi:MAG TPA: hypothetical protein VLB01_06430 [Thermodesulfobacteriota bacterium]|nr:hypothetical protein [Thermodesulfobacteriota bacterium]